MNRNGANCDGESYRQPNPPAQRREYSRASVKTQQQRTLIEAARLSGVVIMQTFACGRVAAPLKPQLSQQLRPAQPRKVSRRRWVCSASSADTPQTLMDDPGVVLLLASGISAVAHCTPCVLLQSIIDPAEPPVLTLCLCLSVAGPA